MTTKRSKYGNKKTVVNGKTFDSKKEAMRYMDLKLLETAGHIQDLQLQVKFPLKINGVLVCSYIADFTYTENGQQITEDVKGCKTSIYNLKKKLMKALHGIEIKEV